MNSYRISHYEIFEKLGAGGMGEVYKAHDTTLDRLVALKVLPPDLVEDEDRLNRFIQEAKSASALNHPHIITIYEIGQARPEIVETRAGDSKGRTTKVASGSLLLMSCETPIHYIAMEYIEGETLHTKIHRDQTNLRKLLEYLIQAIDGLGKAHVAGIVHRDLKPDNIMINKDGFTKILDFGLAKLVEPVKDLTNAAGEDLAEVATVLMRHSKPGVVMGTVGYMSPEQAQGKPVDQRSDIFAFGCILYEVATGHKPFEGDSLIDSLHKIIYTPAPPVKEFNPNCPYELQRIIRRCLAKDPEDRYQRVRDISVDLREFLEEYKTESSADSIYPGISVGSEASGRVSALDAPRVEPPLDECDSRVLQLSRFSKSSVALSVLGLVGAILFWPMHQRGNVGSELKLDYTREAALTKAREIVNGFGYNAGNLENYTRFMATDFNLKHVAANQGIGEARRAVREGKVAVWQILLAPSADEASPVILADGKLKQGQFWVFINPQGQLASFTTSREEGVGITELDQKQALAFAAEQARRWFSFDPAGYEAEIVSRTYPHGVVEITWRNANPIFAHKEVVQADLQGAKLTRLRRWLEPPPSIDGTGWLSDAIRKAQRAIQVLAFVAMYIFGVVFLIRGKRWHALGRKLPIIATVLCAAGLFGTMYFVGLPLPPLVTVLIAVVLAVIGAVAFLPSAAGIVEWLRVFNPVRLFGAEQLTNGRFLSGSAASSLVHGTLGGALLMGISSGYDFLMMRLPGSIPSLYGQIEMVNGGWAVVLTLPLSAAYALTLAFSIAILIELTERLVRGQVFASLVPAFMFALLTTSFSQPRLLFKMLIFLFVFVGSLVAVHLYRSRGLAAAWVAFATKDFLESAVVARYLQDPNFILLSNVFVLIVALLLVTGAWGYLKNRIRPNLSAVRAR